MIIKKIKKLSLYICLLTCFSDSLLASQKREDINTVIARTLHKEYGDLENETREIIGLLDYGEGKNLSLVEFIIGIAKKNQDMRPKFEALFDKVLGHPSAHAFADRVNPCRRDQVPCVLNQSPLSCAVLINDIRKVEILLKMGAKLNNNNVAVCAYNPLKVAVEQANPEMIRLLLKNNADPSIQYVPEMYKYGLPSYWAPEEISRFILLDGVLNLLGLKYTPHHPRTNIVETIKMLLTTKSLFGKEYKKRWETPECMGNMLTSTEKHEIKELLQRNDFEETEIFEKEELFNRKGFEEQEKIQRSVLFTLMNQKLLKK